MGLNALAINAQQAPNTNIKEVMGPSRESLDLDKNGEITGLELAECTRMYGNNLRIACEELNLGILATKGLYLEQVYDQTIYLDSASQLVQSNVYQGGILAVVILLLFLKSVRTVIIIGLSIPISVIATFMFVKIFGRSISGSGSVSPGWRSPSGWSRTTRSLSSKTSLVTFKWASHLAKPHCREHQKSGTVLAATLAMIVVLVPVIFVQGQAGQLFQDISIAIACSVGISMLVSVTVIPAAACWLLRDRKLQPRIRSQLRTVRGLFGLVRLSHWINEWFAKAMRTMMSTRGSWLWRLLVVLFFCAASVWSSFLLWPATEYLPNGNRNLVFAILPASNRLQHRQDD